MAPPNSTHVRSHSLLLLNKLLNLRDGASPLTLILDSLQQPAAPVISEFITRAKLSKSKVVLVSFATIRKPHDVDVMVKATGKDAAAIRRELLSHYPAASPAATAASANAQRVVIIIDSVNTLASTIPQALAAFLASIVTPSSSIIAIHHTDVPVLRPPSATISAYEPAPLTVLCHLATAVLRLSSLRHELARRRARDRALVEPEWGIDEEREGVLVGLHDDDDDDVDGESDGVVIGMELRRRSGRVVAERFVLLRQTAGPGRVILLADHKGFAPPQEEVGDGAGGGGEGGAEPASTFDLGLTEKQRRDREGIVLPYFDAQTDVGGGEGGRILYDMGREDDFDEEEDEI